MTQFLGGAGAGTTGQGQINAGLSGMTWTILPEQVAPPRASAMIAAIYSRYTLVADVGAFVLTGLAARLAVTRKLLAAKGTYALTGLAARLAPTRKLLAAKGTYLLTGQAARLAASRKLVAAKGVFGESGQAARLAPSRILHASHGTFIVTGQNAGLIYTPGGGGGASYTLTAATGSFLVTGQNAGLIYAPAGGGGGGGGGGIIWQYGWRTHFNNLGCFWRKRKKCRPRAVRRAAARARAIEEVLGARARTVEEVIGPAELSAPLAAPRVYRLIAAPGRYTVSGGDALIAEPLMERRLDMDDTEEMLQLLILAGEL